jgi:hypothetical protein
LRLKYSEVLVGKNGNKTVEQILHRLGFLLPGLTRMVGFRILRIGQWTWFGLRTLWLILRIGCGNSDLDFSAVTSLGLDFDVGFGFGIRWYWITCRTGFGWFCLDIVPLMK